MKEELNKLLAQVSQNFNDLKVVALSTIDGFSIYSSDNGANEQENEKIAAISSSLHSLSNAAAKQLAGNKLMTTTLETSDGFIFFFSTTYEERECVLCIATGASENVAKARYFSQKIADFIGK
ncbi:MAG: roadblock/LC7 domain-containing protein [Gammaproteobacteria bacterium]|nr:roadblock/LC7 domain-containing protein [Gammaproteobacteria bacterium]MBQ0774553.1 roadblock/LC7 domain-containing protein [Gammaproteobacteria bacterium]